MKNKKVLPVTLLTVLFPLIAFCQPELGSGRDEVKTVSQARSLAVFNTIVPVATGVGAVTLFENNTLRKAGAITALYGLAVGPATGNLYANDYTRGYFGILARAAGGYLMRDAVSEIFGRRFADVLGVDNREVSLTDTKILIGEGLILGGILYNILSAASSVRAHNAARGGNIRISVEPQRVYGPFSDNYAPAITGRIPL